MPVIVRICVCFAILAAPLWAGDLEGARQLYQHAAYDAAWRVLESKDCQDARVLLLAGQIHYQLGNYKEAAGQLEIASQLQPGGAEIFLWLGRSLGRRAEASNFFTAPGDAVRCRETLERAVALDGHNVDALSALAAYYLEAPRFLGGGLEKAQRLAALMATLDAAEEQSVAARMAEKR